MTLFITSHSNNCVLPEGEYKTRSIKYVSTFIKGVLFNSVQLTDAKILACVLHYKLTWS